MAETMKATTSIIAASVVAVASAEVFPAPLRMRCGPMSATVVPAWGGRLMELSRDGGANALWTDPAAVTNGLDSAGRQIWKNVGGEKTWVGSQGPGWRGFNPDGKVWPPPSWFDSAPLSVVHSDATNVLLRSGFHESHGWRVALEREQAKAAELAARKAEQERVRKEREQKREEERQRQARDRAVSEVAGTLLSPVFGKRTGTQIARGILSTWFKN